MLVWAGPERHPRPLRRRLAAAVLAGQPSAGERPERRIAEALPRAELEHAVLVAALEQRVRVLHPVDAAASPTGAAERLLEPDRVDVAAAEGAELPLALELGERADRLLERRRGIGLVGEVEIDRL